MNELQVTGKQEFMGKEIPIVLGGFGEDKKCISDKTIAEIHGMEAFHVRELINRNMRRFNKNIDVIDLKAIVLNDDGTNFKNMIDLLGNLGYSTQQITKSNHLYLLSERGYAKLIKIMDTDLAWEIHDKLIDEYFQMREIIQNQFVLPKTYPEALRALADEAERNEQLELEVKQKESVIVELKPKAEFADKYIVSDHAISIKEFAAILTQNGCKIGQNNLFKRLRNDGYLCKSGIRYNLPKQNLIEEGYFTVDTYIYYDKCEEKEKFNSRTMVTPKGQKHLMEKLMKEAA